MGASALSEAKLGVTALRAIGQQEINIGVKSLARKEFAKAFWHGGLATSGFFRQGIKNLGPAGKEFMHRRDTAVWWDMTFQISPSKWQQKTLWQPVWGDLTEAVKFVKGIQAPPASLYSKVVDTTHALFTGGNDLEKGWGKWGKHVGLFAWADYHFSSENIQAVNLMLQKDWQHHQGTTIEQKLFSTMLEHGRRGQSYHPEAKQTHLDSNNVAPELLDHAPHSVLAQYAKQLTHKTVNADDKSGEALLLRAEQVLSLEDSDPLRQQLAAEVSDTFNAGNSPEDKTAAAIAALVMRQSDDLDERLGTARLADVIHYLRNQAYQSANPDIRLAAADALMRTTNQHTESVSAAYGEFTQLRLQAMRLERAHEKNQQKYPEAELKKAAQKLETIKQFYNNCKFDYVDMSSVCLNVINDPNATRDQRIGALISSSGPRLDLMLDALKTEVEPGIKKITSPTERLYELANLYGRGSKAIETSLRKLAANPKEDPDIRALCLQVLETNSPALLTVEVKNKAGDKAAGNAPVTVGTETILGANDLIHGQGVQLTHAAARINAADEIEIRDCASKGGTWITHADGKQERVGREWTRLKEGDQVVLGDKGKGAILHFGDDRATRLNALHQMAARASTPGAIAQTYREQMASRLRKDTSKQAIPSLLERQAARWDKYLAAKSVLDSNFDPIFGDGGENRALVTAALADCIQFSQPDLTAKALPLLNADLFRTLNSKQIETIQQTCLSILASAPSRMDQSRISNLKELIAENALTVFATANKATLDRTSDLLECLLVDGQSKTLATSKPGLYPPYPVTEPELRVAALRALEQIAPQRAAIVAPALLSGGKVDNIAVKKDTAFVRMAALDILTATQPTNLQEITLSALKTESDPTVLARLENIEYKGRRPNTDPAKEFKDLETIRHRLAARGKQSLLDQGKQKVAALKEIDAEKKHGGLS